MFRSAITRAAGQSDFAEHAGDDNKVSLPPNVGVGGPTGGEQVMKKSVDRYIKAIGAA